MLQNPLKLTEKGPHADVAACQIEAVHEDVLVGMLDALAAHGLSSHSMLNARIASQRGDFFEVVPPRKGTVEYLDCDGLEGWEALERRMRSVKPRLVFFNTFQRRGQAELMLRLGKPAWGVVHNPTLFASFPECLRVAEKGQIEAFVLAPHVAEALEKTVPALKGHIHVHHPIGWAAQGADTWSLPDEGAPLEIAIPGTVDYKGRAWEEMLEHLSATQTVASRPVRFVIVAGGPDRADFFARVEALGLSDLFDFEPLDPETRRVPHRALMERLYRAHAIMPMLPPNRMDFLTSKISTAMPACVGTARPTLLPAHIAEIYGMPAIEVPRERPFDLRKADLSDATLTAARAAVVARRAEMEQENIDTIRPLLERI